MKLPLARLRSEVSASTSQVADKLLNQQLPLQKPQVVQILRSETATNFDVSALTSSAVNTSLVSQPATTTEATFQVKELMSTKERTELRINLRCLPRLNFM